MDEERNFLTVKCDYDFMGRRVFKKIIRGNSTVISHQRFIYRGYLQIACVDLTRTNHPCLWLITWDPTQPVATRPLAIQKDGTWYTYGLDLTKNVCEVFGATGYIRTAYTYSPYGQVTATGNVTQPIQWSSEFYDEELGLDYYNYRYYNPLSGKWINRDLLQEYVSMNRYLLVNNTPIHNNDYLGLSKLPNCNQENTGNKQYTCSKLGISNANSNFRFNDVIDNLDRLLKDIDKMEQLMNLSSFATARNANDVIDAVSEQIISNGTDIGADNAWILKKLQIIANRYKNLFGASIDVEITVNQCMCSNIFIQLLSFGTLDRYYWEEIDKKVYSFVLYRSGRMTQRKEGGKYNFTKIKTPDKLTKHEIDTAILSAIILTRR